MHNSANLIKCQLWCSEMIICRRVADYRRSPRRQHSTHPYFWAQEEPNGASERGAEWPRYGGCVVATARTHARSWRKKHGAAGMGLGTALTHHKGLASTLSCSFIQESPNYLQKVGRRTHKKNIAAKWWRRLQQLPLGAAQSGDAAIAQRRTSPILHKLRDSSRNTHLIAPFSLSSSGVPRTRAQDRSPFSWHDLHRPHYPRRSPFTRSSCQPGGERHYFGPQRGASSTRPQHEPS